jgi:endonuclease/exonuclease/phosphatase family metal-dependent hydrolase
MAMPEREQLSIEPRGLRVVTWNVAGRVGALPAQAAYLASLAPDIVALQEVTLRSVGPWRSALESDVGMAHVADSFSLAPDLGVLKGPRRYGQIIASRYPVRAIAPSGFDAPWPERVLSAWLDTPFSAIEFHTTHIPPGSTNGWIKIEMLEAIAARLGRGHEGHRLLCGDFNMPQTETSEGEIIYWDMRRRSNGSYAPKKGRAPRWGDAERAVHEGLGDFDLRDVHQALRHVPAADAHSWIPVKGRARTPRRFDHIYASRSLNIARYAYEHRPRTARLSDHSVLMADFEPI